MKLDPRLRKIVRELYGDGGGDDDHALAIKMCVANEIAHVVGIGELIADGKVYRSYNKLLQSGPEMMMRRVFNLTIPAVPSFIQLGIGTGAETLNSGLTQCQTPTTDAVIAMAAATSVVQSSSGGPYPNDTVTVNRAYGLLTGLVGTINIAEMSLQNNTTPAATTGWGRILLPAVVPITAATTLTANYITRASG